MSVFCLTATGFFVIISVALRLSRLLPCLIAWKISIAVTKPISQSRYLAFVIRYVSSSDYL